MSKDSKLAEIHDTALRAFGKIQSAVYEERMQCLEDRRFYSIAGAQWEGAVGELFQNKTRIEVNKIHLAIVSIINEYRNNRISVTFSPKDGTKSNKTADMCAGLYRADEKDSGAEEAYDNAFEEAVGGGLGAWRLRTEYEDEGDEDSERQRIRIEPIFDADSCVYFDLDAKRQDKSDAKFCYVLNSMTHDQFEEEFGEDPKDWPKAVDQSQYDWCKPDVVYVAEYYLVEEVKETVVFFQGLDGSTVKHTEKYLKGNVDVHDELLALGYKEVRRKKVKKKKVRKYILSGGNVIQDCGYIAGKNIPIIPVYGKRWFIDGTERCMGHVRMAKDPQRLKNMQVSKLAEISAQSSVEKPIFTPAQVAGHQTMWAKDSVEDYAYLLLNPLVNLDGSLSPIGPIGTTKSPNVPPALAGLLQITDQDIKEILGNQNAAEELVSHVSGSAVEMIQNKIGMYPYIYMSNMAKAIKRSGEVWLGIAKEIFVEPNRKMKTISPEGKSNQVELLRPVISEETGDIEYENDLSSSDFDVNVDVGPSSSSKRQALIKGLTAMMQFVQDPETAQILTFMSMTNMEGEGLDDIREYFRKKLVSLGVVMPSEEDKARLQQEAQQQQPDPNAVFLQASAEEAMAKAEKARADAGLSIAKAEETKAKTISTLAGIEQEERRVLTEEQERVAGRSPSIEGTTQPQ